MKRLLLIPALAASLLVSADTIAVNQARYAGAIAVTPMINSENSDSARAVQAMSLTANPLASSFTSIDISQGLPVTSEGAALHVLEFDIENRDYAPASIIIEGIANYEASIDGKPVTPAMPLLPATHTVQVKYPSWAECNLDSATIKVACDRDGAISIPDDGRRIITLDDILYGVRITSASISPSGALLIATYSDTGESGRPDYYQLIFDTKTGKQIARTEGHAQWMPRTDMLLVERNDYEHGRHVVSVDPLTGAEKMLASHMPEGYYQLAPSGDFLAFALTKKGKQEDPRAYQVTEPEDRQPGWRDKTYPALLKLNGSNTLIPLSDGSQNLYITDISADGKKLLMMASKTRLERRPTTVFDILLYDIDSQSIDTLASNDGFLGGALFSPRADKVLATGTPEAFDRIGCQLPADKYPNMTEQELFVIDVATKDVTPITKDFDPSIVSSVWSEHDNNVYARVEERDIYALYRIDPATGKYQRVELPENILKGFDLALSKPLAVFWAQSDSNPDRLYLLNLANGKSTLLDQPSATRLADVKLAQCQDWNFENSKGDTIYGRFYLPDNFDPDKKYPLIVNYYGGCSPTQRLFESRYPHHVYAQQGYVVYVIQPSGATGFGQEFASRHVNTAGEGVAQDIIEGVTKFMEEHPYVDSSKVGCIGASYGGFMTQYLQTVTDIFACAISHAGISDHTSYWGEGYWGYSYSEVSMAGSYPWSDPDLYVKQSPLYNADKVNTPILFLHGDADNNVPVGESIQMFTALKLLGKDTALVEIPGQDHHIIDYAKRKRWQDTIFAWFAKYLKDDPSWWNSMYQ